MVYPLSKGNMLVTETDKSKMPSEIGKQQQTVLCRLTKKKREKKKIRVDCNELTNNSSQSKALQERDMRSK